MGIQIQITEDGSHTLFWEEKNEHYHSVHGSLQEARKVYLETALFPAIRAFREGAVPCVRVFEMGFGTGLNALLTLLEAKNQEIPIEYVAVEAYPLDERIWTGLNYPQRLGLADGSLFRSLHLQAFDSLPHRPDPFFSLTKIRSRMEDLNLPSGYFHAVYYDAFAPSVQPELWEEGVFRRLFQAAARPCFLSSYCAQGRFRRNLRQAGFEVERLPGPVGKREITRAKIY